MTLQIITTSDGSHSLLNTELNETYHSVHGAVQESLHIFIQHGLDDYIKGSSSSPIQILEIGFGTGLNALLTINYAMQTHRIIEYTSLEAAPIDESLISILNYPQVLSTQDARFYFKQLHDTPWGRPAEIMSNFRLEKRHEKVQDAVLELSKYDIIYFDAFAPSKQPEMWELPILKRVIDSMRPGGVFVTYCAKGQLKRDLKSLGLTVETLPGPPGKKEMVRGRK